MAIWPSVVLNHDLHHFANTRVLWVLLSWSWACWSLSWSRKWGFVFAILVLIELNLAFVLVDYEFLYLVWGEAAGVTLDGFEIVFSVKRLDWHQLCIRISLEFFLNNLVTDVLKIREGHEVVTDFSSWWHLEWILWLNHFLISGWHRAPMDWANVLRQIDHIEAPFVLRRLPVARRYLYWLVLFTILLVFAFDQASLKLFTSNRRLKIAPTWTAFNICNCLPLSSSKTFTTEDISASHLIIFCHRFWRVKCHPGLHLLFR